MKKTWTRAAVATGLVAAGVGGGLYCCGGSPALQPDELTNAEELRRLSEGEVLIVEMPPTGGEGVAAVAKGVIDAPVDTVWPIVRDCQHFHEFMPRTAKSELRARDGDEMTCFVEIDMPWPISNLKSETRSRIERLGGGAMRRSWTHAAGTYKRNNGSWLARPFPGRPDRTLLIYEIDVDPAMPIPDAILRKAQTGSLPKMFTAIAKRAGVKPLKAR